MFLWFGTAKRTRRVKGGRKQTAFCPDCRSETKFVEVEIEEKVALFSVIDLVDDKERAFRCTECGAVGQIADDGAATAGAIEDLSQAAAHERLLAEAQADRERRARERQEREAKADQELLALKARMGLAEAPAEDAPADDDSAPRRPWWRVWR